MPLEEVRQQLMTIQGVGPKVAECAALYGLHRLEAFLWMFDETSNGDFVPK